MRRLKRSTTLLQSSRNCFRGERAWPTGPAFARIKSAAVLYCQVAGRCARNVRATHCRYGASRVGISYRLIQAEHVRLAWGDLAELHAVCRDMRVMRSTRRLLPLLSCDGTKAQQHEHYSYCECHDCFGRQIHCDYVFCSDAFSRNSFHPPPELNEVML